MTTVTTKVDIRVTKIPEVFSLMDQEFLQAMVSKNYKNLLHDWQEATNGSELPPNNYAELQRINDWTLLKLKTVLENFVSYYNLHGDTWSQDGESYWELASDFGGDLQFVLLWYSFYEEDEIT